MSRRLVLSLAGGLIALAAILAALGVGERPQALTDWQAFTLGATQGLTELLPISSSGHLILVPWLGGWTFLETHETFNKTFDVALHLGTLVAVVVYFWRDVVGFTTAWLRTLRRRRIETAEERTAWYIAVATVPTALVGAALESSIDTRLGDPWQIAILLAVLGAVLWFADRLPERREIEGLTFASGVGIGLSQVLALAPGVSRSGATITAGRLLGLSRDAAARFSFFLLVPIVLGAVLYKGVKVAADPLPPGSGGPFLVGVIAAAGFGLLAIDVLLGYVRRHSYLPFVIYRFLLAGAIIVLIVSGVKDATF